jgi:hypothetical protein
LPLAEVTVRRARVFREAARRREAREWSVSTKRDAQIAEGAPNASVVILLREPRVLPRVWRVDVAYGVVAFCELFFVS